MIKKLIIILITTFTLILNVNASSDGELLIKKNNPSEIEIIRKLETMARKIRINGWPSSRSIYVA